MEKCDCYEETKVLRYLTDFEKGVRYGKTGSYVDTVIETKSICNGTKERDVCSCDGDICKCTFYADKRNKALEERNKKVEEMELAFYRDYILKEGLLYDALNKFEKWKKDRDNET